MKQSDQPGYPLPSGVLGSDDLVCQLVFLPDRPEYWQAFLGAYSYLCTWRAWERDEAKRGKDAASNWREAQELTLECWRMACLEQLQSDVSDILETLQASEPCCSPGDPTNGDQFTDVVSDGVGNVPQNVIDAGYASGVTDWSGFDDYKCMVSHVVVDSIEAKLRKLAPHVDSAAHIAGGISTLVIIMTAIWTGGLSLLVAGLLASLGATAILYNFMLSGSLLVTLADDVATLHDDLACAYYNSDGSAEAVASLFDKIDEEFSVTEAIILKNTGVEIDSKALYAGRYDQVDVAAALEAKGYELTDFDCTCPLEAGYNWVTTPAITYTLEPNTFGRINEGSVTLPSIQIGRKVATSASWGCMAWPAGLATLNAKNSTYQTLAVRFKTLAYSGNSHPWIDGACRVPLQTPGNRHIWFYTLDTANGIDAAWAVANSESYRVQAGGHAKRAIGYDWLSGACHVGDTSAGADPVRMTIQIEHLVYVP